MLTDGGKKFDRLPFTGQSLTAISYDTKNKMVYFSDVQSSVIRRGKLDGTQSEVFVRWVHESNKYTSQMSTRVN